MHLKKDNIKKLSITHYNQYYRNCSPLTRRTEEINGTITGTNVNNLKDKHKYTPEKLKNEIEINIRKILNSNYISEKMSRKAMNIFIELMKEAEDNDKRKLICRQLVEESRAISDHLKEDAGQLNEVKRYWIDKGEREKEINRNEVVNSIHRLINMYDGLTEYMEEMANWWAEKRNTPPIIRNFYNGPENLVFLAGIIGYTRTTKKKQMQTRLGIMELEQITQYLVIASGTIQSINILKSHLHRNRYAKKHKKTKEKKNWKIIGNTHKVVKIKHSFNSVKKAKKLTEPMFQMISRIINILGPHWTHSWKPTRYLGQNGNMQTECNPIVICKKRKQNNKKYKKHLFSEIMEDTQADEEKNSDWEEIRRVAKEAVENRENKELLTEIIKIRLEQPDLSKILLKKDVIQDIMPEILQVCRKETLPTQKEDINEIKVKHFESLRYQEEDLIECYCSKEGIAGAKPECTILQGGVKDREYYTALAHKIATELSEHRGITITARFDPAINKESMKTQDCHMGSV